MNEIDYVIKRNVKPFREYIYIYIDNIIDGPYLHAYIDICN